MAAIVDGLKGGGRQEWIGGVWDGGLWGSVKLDEVGFGYFRTIVGVYSIVYLKSCVRGIEGLGEANICWFYLDFDVCENILGGFDYQSILIIINGEDY